MHCTEENVIYNSYPGMNIICRMDAELYSITSDGSYTGLTNLILTLKSNRLSILYQLHQIRLLLKRHVIWVTTVIQLFLLSVKEVRKSNTLIRNAIFKHSYECNWRIDKVRKYDVRAFHTFKLES